MWRKVYKERDKTITHFFEDGLHFITHFEGTFFTTLKTMATRPGQLSLDYCSGTRKKYFKPLSLFLLLVILYLLFPYFQGLNQNLKFYTTSSEYGKFATREINHVLLKTGMSMEQLSELFHEKAEKLSKFLLIIIIPFTALFFKAIFYRRKKFFFDFLIYSTEINSVFLLWGFLLLPFFVSIIIFFHPVSSKVNENFSVLLIVYLPFLFFTAFSAKRFFKTNWLQSGIASILFMCAHFLILQGIYKFILFQFTICSFNKDVGNDELKATFL